MGRREVYRRRGLLAYNLVLAGGFEAIGLVGVISTVQAGFWPGVVLLSLFVLTTTAGVIAFARVSVVATPTALVLRDYFRTTRVAWRDIDRICLSGEDAERQVTIVLRGGHRLRPTAFEGGRGWRAPKSANAFARHFQQRVSPTR